MRVCKGGFGQIKKGIEKIVSCYPAKSNLSDCSVFTNEANIGIVSYDEESANGVAIVLNLPKPFLCINDKYVLNRNGS